MFFSLILIIFLHRRVVKWPDYRKFHYFHLYYSLFLHKKTPRYARRLCNTFAITTMIYYSLVITSNDNSIARCRRCSTLSRILNYFSLINQNIRNKIERLIHHSINRYVHAIGVRRSFGWDTAVASLPKRYAHRVYVYIRFEIYARTRADRRELIRN